MSLEEHTQILEGMVPRIKLIDNKMDEGLQKTQNLHDEQINAFEAGMRQQNLAISESRNVLDLHTGHNKQHQEHLKQQMEIARKHREEMEVFKKQLDELRDLRKQDERLKLEQMKRHQVLEEQHQAELASFSKELKQQRVLREMEFAKQAKITKKQTDELVKAHQVCLGLEFLCILVFGDMVLKL